MSERLLGILGSNTSIREEERYAAHNGRGRTRI
jgi:hypothetical protein